MPRVGSMAFNSIPKLPIRHKVCRCSQNFLYGVCGCSPNWTMQAFVDPAVAAIRGNVGEERVLCALSGGVDSSVTALLGTPCYRRAADLYLCR